MRFSYDKIFWRGSDFYDELPQRLNGTFTQWNVTKDLKPKILWDDGETDINITLTELAACSRGEVQAGAVRGRAPTAAYEAPPQRRLERARADRRR